MQSTQVGLKTCHAKHTSWLQNLTTLAACQKPKELLAQHTNKTKHNVHGAYRSDRRRIPRALGYGRAQAFEVIQNLGNENEKF
jgi:hypothetical protein